MKIIVLSGTGEPAFAALSIYAEGFAQDELAIVFERRSSQRIIRTLRRYLERNGFIAAIGFIALQFIESLRKSQYQPPDLPNTITTSDINSTEVLQFIRSEAPDVILTNACGVLTKPTLEQLRGTPVINVHNGITPRYRGTGNIWAVLERNLHLCGVTVHRVDAGIDTGEVIANKRLQPSRFPQFNTEAFIEGAKLVVAHIKDQSSVVEVDTSKLRSAYYSFAGLKDLVEANRIASDLKNPSGIKMQDRFDSQALQTSLDTLQKQSWTNSATVSWHDTRIVEEVRRRSRGDSTVVDIGCGDGRFANLLPSTMTYIGVDYSFNLLRALARGKPIVCASADQLPFGEDAFDICLLVGVLQHNDTYGEIIDETLRIGGKSCSMLILNTLRDLSLPELILLLGPALIVGRYRSLIIERINYKLQRSQATSGFVRVTPHQIRSHLDAAGRKKTKFVYNGVCGTRMFATEFIAINESDGL